MDVNNLAALYCAAFDEVTKMYKVMISYKDKDSISILAESPATVGKLVESLSSEAGINWVNVAPVSRRDLLRTVDDVNDFIFSLER